MKTFCFCLALLCSGPVLRGQAADPVPLFNGHDLSGWTFDVKDGADPHEIWSVRDGLLVCNGRTPGVIRTGKSYREYELTVEWRWAPGTKGGNSGCLIHCSTPRQLDIWPKSIEVQLMSGNAGDFWMIGESIDVPEERKDSRNERHLLNLTEDSEKPVGEWNTLRVRCERTKVTVWVNNDKVNEGNNCSVSEGAISLQSEGAAIQFRKVELKPLE